MSGHQAQVWHPGILAKVIALNAAATRAGAAAAWIVVDHDENDPLSLRAPYIDRDGRLALATFGPQAVNPEAPACRLAPWSPPMPWQFPAGAADAAPGVRQGLERVRQALINFTNSPDAAWQATAATFELAQPLAPTPFIVRATALARTSLLAELVSRMQHDPRACAEAHNAAVRAFPHERIAPLAIESGRIELPLWAIADVPGSPRRRVLAADLASIPTHSLAPRALLLTGLVRLAGCDLFIHGLGGERYDRITDLWLRTWLGRTLAPTTVVSATMRLPMQGCRPSPAVIAKSVWAWHHAEHDPAMLGDAARAARKQELLARIRSAPRNSRARLDLFAQLHELRRQAASDHPDAILRFQNDAAAMQSRAAEAAIADDRTWAFPLHEPERLAALRDAIHAQFV